MTQRLFISLMFALACGCLATRSATADDANPNTARAQFAKNGLFEYVAKPDKNYAWKKRRSGTIGKSAYAELTLTSQKWRDVTWKHQLFIIKPSTMKADNRHALLLIEGGRWNDGLGGPADGDKPPREAATFADLAEKLQTPLVILLQVPHQPILGGLIEDAAISYTFEKFMRTNDKEWPLLLPMTKSAVRAMDATQEFAQQEWKLKLEEFTVTGASKRGWTTWLTGAVDSRVGAIAPMVIDMLNMEPQLKHQVTAWGDYSAKIHDYTDRGLQKHINTPPGKALRQMVDPYTFRSILRQPKLIILGTNDNYWPLDALSHYWDGLNGKKYVLYIPNNRHALRDLPRLLGSIVALNDHTRRGKPLPQLSWKFTQENGNLDLAMQTNLPPTKVRIWMASSKSRDFRQANWMSVDLEKPNGDGENDYSFAVPKTGYLAMFGEWQFAAESLPYFLSTNVKIVSREE